MKPLQTLDHVMLWIARGFALYLVAELLRSAFTVCANDYEWVMRTFHRHGAFAWNFNFDGLNFPLILAISALWAVCLFRLSNDAGRLLLASSGAMLFLAFIFVAVETAAGCLWHHFPTAGDWVAFGPPVLGFFAMAWTGLRPPRQPPLKLMPLTRCRAAHAKDISTNFSGPFRYSVNSV